MSRRNKLAKFAEIAAMPNVYENFSVQDPRLMSDPDTEVDLQGRWATNHFGNDLPITLELACGRGEYTVGLARRFPERNFIGVDVKGARIWKGAKQAEAEKLRNAAFLRTRIECLTSFFAPGEIDEMWITFPDPFPRFGQANRRLTSPVFLKLYKQLIRPGGTLHLKTDNTALFLYSLEQVLADAALQIELVSDNVDFLTDEITELSIPTFYERLHRGEGAFIKYLRMSCVDAE